MNNYKFYGYLFLVFIFSIHKLFADFEGLDIELMPRFPKRENLLEPSSTIEKEEYIPPFRLALVKEGDGQLKGRIVCETEEINFDGTRKHVTVFKNTVIEEGVHLKFYMALKLKKPRAGEWRATETSEYGAYYQFSPKVLDSKTTGAKATLIIDYGSYEMDFKVKSKDQKRQRGTETKNCIQIKRSRAI